jgi:hypothetical protein
MGRASVERVVAESWLASASLEGSPTPPGTRAAMPPTGARRWCHYLRLDDYRDMVDPSDSTIP